MPNSLLDTSNCTLSFKVRGAQTGRDPVTRHPIYTETTLNIAAYVVQAKEPVTSIFPGADEMANLLKGRCVAPMLLPASINPDGLCTLSIADGVSVTAQIKPLVAFSGDSENYQGRKRKGQPFFLLTKRG